jgi:hypothetical protein
MHPKAHISHQTKGRLRIKIPAKKGDQLFFASLKDSLAKLKDISEIRTNHVTGSALILHSSDTASIRKFAEEGNLFKMIDTAISHPRISRSMYHGFKDLDRTIRSATGGELDVPSVAFLSLIGMGIYDLSRGNIAAPAWYTAFWYALNIFLKAKPDGNEGELA